MGGGIFGLFPTSILGEIGDFIPSDSDRYTYTVSVSNSYHSLGRGGVETLREASGPERAEEWDQAMQAHRDASAATATEKEARLKANYKKPKAFWYSKGATFGWGYRVLAKEFKFPLPG